MASASQRSDLQAPPADPVRPAPVGAQQPVLCPAPPARPARRPPGRRPGSPRRSPDVAGQPAEGVGARAGSASRSISRNRTADEPDRSSAITASSFAAADGPGQGVDGPPNRQVWLSCTTPCTGSGSPGPAAPTSASRAASRAVGRPGSPHDVGQHGAGLDRGQLVRVADQHQPRGRPDRLDQPGHQGERHHRHLVDHHDVVRQLVAGVVPEPAPGLRQPAEQPVQGRRPQVARAAPGRPPAARPRPRRTASSSRAAALPVGAASPIRTGRPGWSSSSASSRATVVVLPVPGPPDSTLTQLSALTAAASRCGIGLAVDRRPGTAGPGRRPAARRRRPAGRRPRRCCRPSRTCSSCCQYRSR